MCSITVKYHCYSDEKVYAHDFSTTSDASLVTLLEELIVETALVNSDILFSDNISVQSMLLMLQSFCIVLIIIYLLWEIQKIFHRYTTKECVQLLL
jgi:hypothetical protein